MGSSRLAFAAVGLACVAAAATGSYVATRHNMADRASATVSASQSSAPVTAPASVQETPTAVEPAQPAPSGPVIRSASPSAPAQPRASDPARTATSARSASQVQPQPQPRATRPSAAARPEQSVVPLDRSPQSAAVPPVEPAPAVDASATLAETLPSESARTPEPPPAPAFEEVTVSADSVIGLQTETTLSSERARVEDRVEARVVRDVRVGGRVAIPEGARALGSVVVVERGGKMRDRARLGIRFHTLALADGTRLPITTETIYRYGDAPGNGSAAKIGGGAVAGAILGAIIGGGKGAAIGATTGAAGGGAAVMAGDRSEAVFPAGSQVTARILSPVTVTVDR